MEILKKYLNTKYTGNTKNTGNTKDIKNTENTWNTGNTCYTIETLEIQKKIPEVLNYQQC